MQNATQKQRPAIESDLPVFEDDKAVRENKSPAPEGKHKKNNSRQVKKLNKEEQANKEKPVEPAEKGIEKTDFAASSTEGNIYKLVKDSSDTSEDIYEEVTEPIVDPAVHTPVNVNKTIPKISKKLSYKALAPILERKADTIAASIEIPPSAAQPHTAPLVNAQPEAQFYLINKGTGEVITIPGTLKIGNDASFADYIPMKNRTVSQKHAIFTSERGILMVKDVGSSNGTYINGVRIPVGFNIQIEPGQVVALSNEAFIVQKD